MSFRIPHLDGNGRLSSSVMPEAGLPSPFTVGYVYVVSGNEPRPDAGLVIWIGGADRPEHCLDGDLWASSVPQGEAPPVLTDTTAPSVPSGVVISDQTASSFKVSWTASTDAVGVSGYEVQIDGVAQSTSATTLVISGRSAATSHTVRVRARDAAGNWSALSAAVTATTTAPAQAGGVRHSVFPDPPVIPYTLFSDGGTIRVANTFYTYQSDTTGWKAVGVKVYVPAGAVIPDDTAVYFFDTLIGLYPDLSSPARTAVLGSVVSGQWNEALFDTPYVMTTGTPYWVGYQTPDGSYVHSHKSNFWGEPIVASDGSHVAFAGSPDMFEVGQIVRSFFSADGGPATEGNGASYGVDIIVEEA